MLPDPGTMAPRLPGNRPVFVDRRRGVGVPNGRHKAARLLADVPVRAEYAHPQTEIERELRIYAPIVLNVWLEDLEPV